MKKVIFPAAVFLSGCLWGTMGYFRRTLGSMGLGSVEIILIRFGFAALLYAATMCITNPGSLKIKLRDVPYFLGSGVLSLLFFSTCYFQAMNLMSLSAAAILLYTAPCFVILLSSLFFGEKINSAKIFALLLAFGGCCLVSGVIGAELKISTIGILYGLGAGIGYALYSIFGKLILRRGYASVTISFWSSLFAAIGAGVLVGIRGPAAVVFSSWSSFGFCVLTAVITTYLPYMLYTFGLSGMEAGSASIIASVEPVVATLVGLTVFGEKLNIWSVSGIILVLAAIVILNINTAATSKSKKA